MFQRSTGRGLDRRGTGSRARPGRWELRGGRGQCRPRSCWPRVRRWGRPGCRANWPPSDPLSEAEPIGHPEPDVGGPGPGAFGPGRTIPAVTARTVVSGGTARALARLAMARTRGKASGRSSEVNQVELPTSQVAALSSQLARLNLRERLALPGMPARRAPMLPIGAAILETFAVELGVDHFVVSEWGLREGCSPRRDRSSLTMIGGAPLPTAPVSAVTFLIASGLLAQDPIHLGTAGRAGALGGTSSVRQFDLVAIELPLLPTFNAVALVRSHVGLLTLLRPAKGSGRSYRRACRCTWMLGPRRRVRRSKPRILALCVPYGVKTQSESGGAIALCGGWRVSRGVDRGRSASRRWERALVWW